MPSIDEHVSVAGRGELIPYQRVEVNKSYVMATPGVSAIATNFAPFLCQSTLDVTVTVTKFPDFCDTLCYGRLVTKRFVTLTVGREK